MHHISGPPAACTNPITCFEIIKSNKRFTLPHIWSRGLFAVWLLDYDPTGMTRRRRRSLYANVFLGLCFQKVFLETLLDTVQPIIEQNIFISRMCNERKYMRNQLLTPFYKLRCVVAQNETHTRRPDNNNNDNNKVFKVYSYSSLESFGAIVRHLRLQYGYANPI
jgi:hypothetical protein